MFVHVAGLLTIREVAAELKVGMRTVVAYIKSGDLRAMRGLGRGLGYRIKREWLDAFLRVQEVRAGAVDEAPTPTVPRGSRDARPPATPAFRSVRDARAALGLIRGGKS